MNWDRFVLNVAFFRVTFKVLWSLYYIYDLFLYFGYNWIWSSLMRYYEFSAGRLYCALPSEMFASNLDDVENEERIPRNENINKKKMQ